MEISIKGLSKKYKGNKYGLKNFDLELKNVILGLIGPNGAGKSTLMRILATISRPSEGQISLDGIDIVKFPDTVRNILGYLPQDFGVYPNLTAIEFLEYIAAIKGFTGKTTRLRIEALLEELNLITVRNQPIGTYSGGMKQRLGIAQVLVGNPRLLILDEPTVGLDPEERVRSYYFLIALGSSVLIMYSFVPPVNAGYKIMVLGNYRGFYNSAWIGTMVAMCAPFFALIGFYLVNYSVKRDIDTRVGQIIATTRITRVQYLTGKMISNFTVLLVIFIVIVVMTVVMFLIRGETNHLELGKLLYPLMIFTIPSMFITASVALFFDSFTGLNRGVINIGYFILWVLILSSIKHIDVYGFYYGTSEIEHEILTTHPDWNGGNSLCFIPSDHNFKYNIFICEGMKWSSSVILNRIFWMFSAFSLVLLAAIGFNRFDNFKTGALRSKSTRSNKNKTARFNDFGVLLQKKFHDLPLVRGRFSHFILVQAELKLMLKGNSIWWLIITTGLFLTSIFAPMDFAYMIALPLLWFFQVLILSKLGFREVTHRCNEYIFSAAFPLKRQLPATLSAAVLLMLTLAIPVTLRVLLAGNLYNVYAIVIGALFIPTFAITSGILTGGSKLFEVTFAIIMYCFLNKVPLFDFIGAMGGSRELGIAHYLLTITFIMVILAFEGRKRQIMHI